MENSYSNLFIEVKKINEIKDTATIVIDTNVLLMGYQWKNMTFESVLNVLKKLSSENRLKIPAHVIKEFAKNRPKKITEMTSEIHNVISNIPKAISNGKPLNEAIPALAILEDYHSDIIALEEIYNNCIQELNKARKEYVKGLGKLQHALGDYIDHDLILESYKEIIEKSYFAPEGLMDEKQLEIDWDKRSKNSIPPGYMDKAKDSNKYGDLIVWDHICQIKEDVIFVTADLKGDWVHRNDKQVMGARRELVEEFYLRKLAKGHTFKILSPLQFITLFSGKEVKQEIRDDLNKEVQSPIETGSFPNIYKLFIEDNSKEFARLRDNSIIEESYLNKGFDEIERELEIFLINGRGIQRYKKLVQEYKRTLELFIEDPSSEFLRSMDVKSLIDTIRNLNRETEK
ncbi:PIN-like domain-containing protein [Bacillus cereus]|nr:PIN-like domain-containing protein [Bacillus cereus]